jgi:hypothetical protein
MSNKKSSRKQRKSSQGKPAKSVQVQAPIKPEKLVEAENVEPTNLTFDEHLPVQSEITATPKPNVLRLLARPYPLTLVGVILVVGVVMFMHNSKSSENNVANMGSDVIGVQGSVSETLQPAAPANGASSGTGAISVLSAPNTSATALNGTASGLDSLQNASGSSQTHSPATLNSSTSDPQANQYEGAQSAQGSL